MNTSKTSTCIQPYLFFGGNCEEALEFYSRTLGAKVEMIMRYKEAPEPPPEGMLPPGYEEKIMHASFRVGSSLIMASDGCGEMAAFTGFTLSLGLHDKPECERVFTALSEGGVVRMPLEKTFWSPCFGMLTDRYGLGWMVTVAVECGN